MSTPTFQEFNPKFIPWQFESIKYINSFDYTSGICEVMFSGSVGSAKSVNAAHILVRHVIENPGARVLVVRRALKDLKRTFWGLILKHLADIPQLVLNYNKSEMKITLVNGSEIIGDSYDDMNLEKFRSLELSMGVIEEATESNRELYDAIKMRLGRIVKVRKNIMLAITNPDSPSHYLYEYFIQNPTQGKKVFYSLTHQNKFLPEWYVENLRRDLSQKMALRMLEGQWVDLDSERIYYGYSKEKNYSDTSYKFDLSKPVVLCHDFNRAAGKPMSAAVGQYIDGHFHIARAFLVYGGRTQDIMDEISSKGFLDLNDHVYVYGDATGSHNDTRNNRSDWDIIKQYIQNYQRKDGRKNVLFFEVPKANPPIRARHNVANAVFCNDLGEVQATIYKDANQADKGFLLTKPKKGADLIEDDSLAEQHVTTAITYWMHRVKTVLKPGAIVIK